MDPAILARALELTASGMPCLQVSEKLGIPNPTLARWLKRAADHGGDAEAACEPVKTGRPVVWPSNDRISRFTGISLRAVERGIAYLRDAGIISVTYGMRPSRAKIRKVGRLIELNQLVDGLAPVVHFPPPQIMAGIWRSCRAVRSRPAALVAVAVATYVVAAAELGGELTEATQISSPIQMIRSLVGAAHGKTFNDRLLDLERAGLLLRAGKQWREGMIVQLLKKAAPQPIPKLEPAPLQRVEIYAANDGPAPTLEEMVALDAEVAAAFRWRAAARQ
jgi:hypothetical protein